MEQPLLLPSASKASIQITNLEYQIEPQPRSSICRTRPKPRKILKNVNASFEPGTLTAIMGPSGAGKSTLLEAIHLGKATSGDITLNKKKYARKPAIKSLIRAIPQDDVLLPGLTAREMLHFAARLVLPGGAEARRERVDQVLHMLRIQPQDADCKIGSVEQRGLSGGQRKRVSFGLELLADPTVLLVDEPTSGLDAQIALDVIRILKSLAQSGRTIICTVHQPSFHIFSEFDSLLLLTRGSVAYHGPAAAITKYFESIGQPTPPHENPAEHLLTVIESDPQHFLQSWTSHRLKGEFSVGQVDQSGSVQIVVEDSDALLSPSSRPHTGFFRQMRVLCHRRLYDGFRDRGKLPQQIYLRFLLGLLVGIIFFNKGRSNDFTSIFPVTSALFISTFASCMDCILETLLWFPTSRALLRREYRNGMYSIEAYLTAMHLATFVSSIIVAAAFAIPVYTMVGFSPDISRAAIFISCLIAMMLIGGAIGLALGTVSKGIDDARQYLNPLIATMVMFSGYLLPYKDLPRFLSWLYYCSFLQYCLAILQINEFEPRVYTEGCPLELVEDAVYEQVRKELEHWNVSLPARTFHNAVCNGTSALEKQGLFVDGSVAKFGGLGGYFGILSCYYIWFVWFGYVLLKFRLRANAV